MQILKKFLGSNQVGASNIRLENNQTLKARNQADSADVDILYVSTSNQRRISGDLFPHTGGINFGSFSQPFGRLWSSDSVYFTATTGVVNIFDRIFFAANRTDQPDGGPNFDGLFLASLPPARRLGLVTTSSADNNATATNDIAILTGNKTSGTGNSGSIKLYCGTSSGGIRGKIQMEGRCVQLPIAAADPTPAAAGDMYYNSGTNKLKFYNGTAWETVTSAI